MKTVVRGLFYTFDRENQFREIGEVITESKARMRVEHGGDVYTLFKQDAYRLADAAYGGYKLEPGADRPLGRPQLELPHAVTNPDHKPDSYFSHYHPGGVHPDLTDKTRPKAKNSPGHVFFGERNETWKTGNGSASRRDPKAGGAR